MHELTEVLSRTIREKDKTTAILTIIPPAELLPVKRIKTLKTSEKQTKDRQKLQSNRVRKLYNVLTRWDKKLWIIRNL